MSDAEELSRHYAAAVDARNWDVTVALFTEDGVLVTPEPPDHLDPVHEHQGREAIRAALAELESTDSTRHEVLGEEPDGRIAGIAHHVVANRCIDWHLHYVDVYDDADGLLLKRREVHIDRIDVHPAHGK